MSEISERMQRMKAKLDKVASKGAALKSQNEQLKQELETAKSRLQAQEMRITALGEEVNRIKLAKTVVTVSGDKAEMKFKVNEMVKEIDKCIALLNR